MGEQCTTVEVLMGAKIKLGGEGTVDRMKAKVWTENVMSEQTVWSGYISFHECTTGLDNVAGCYCKRECI